MAEDIAFPGEANDYLFFGTPFFVDFDCPRGDKIDPHDRLPFLEDLFSFFELEVFSVGQNGGFPFGQTALAQKAGLQIAVVSFFHLWNT